MRTWILGFLILLNALSAQDLTLNFLKSKPKGIARDFFIWVFLQDPTTTAEEAQEAYALVAYKNAKIQSLMYQKKALEPASKNPCQNLTLADLISKDSSCIVAGLSLSKIFSDAKQEANLPLLKALQRKLSAYPKYYMALEILCNPSNTQTLLKAGAANVAILYNALSYDQRQEFLDKPINPNILTFLANQNNATFNDILQRIILDARFLRFKQVLSQASITHSDSKTFFLLGINALLYNKEQKDLSYFKLSEKSANSDFLHDRALFWQYLISKDRTYLKTLSHSLNPNLFSLYANLILKTPPKYHLVTSLDWLSHKQPYFDIQDPFAWQILKEKILAISDKNTFLRALKPLRTQKSQAHLAYFLSHYYNQQRHYFLTPYEHGIRWKSLQEKAMAYAIARQESLLLPALISRSYALGLMQIMPFNVAPFARQLGFNSISLTDMFNPNVSLLFGNYYINTLKEEFKHPLFVAYCYNGGPNFFRKLLKERHFFSQRRRFDPWLSMELIPYEETRLYGQKVMANYIIYQNIFKHRAHHPHFDIEGFFNATLQKEKP
ncbi:lytic transglycosylase domain-containing protein [Helicobacter suis]|uniref:lytic transglycosylase domain-containing protein n=1 Tax=Helicobacter suis TaxID=104628 RepID=UPI00248FB644|nr:lytic transglycosylase domain-containing protein [Helicobacter suis]